MDTNLGFLLRNHFYAIPDRASAADFLYDLTQIAAELSNDLPAPAPIEARAAGVSWGLVHR